MTSRKNVASPKPAPSHVDVDDSDMDLDSDEIEEKDKCCVWEVQPDAVRNSVSLLLLSGCNVTNVSILCFVLM